MHNGTVFIDLEAMVKQIFDKYLCRGCGNKTEDCDCHPRDEREEFYDDPARSR